MSQVATANSPNLSPLPRGIKGYAVLLQRNTSLRNVWLGQVISQMGDWFNLVALLGLVFDLTKNPASGGLTLVTQILPSAFAGLLISGVVADRFDRKKVMMCADLARGFICLSYLFVRTPETVWLAYAATIGLSIGGSFFNAALSAGMPNLVSKDELPLANALSQSTFASMLLVGSALGGVVATQLGREVCFVVNALSFFVSFVFVWRTHAAFNTAESKQVLAGSSALRVLTEGFRYLKHNPEPRTYALVKPFFSWVFGAMGLYSVYAIYIYKVGDIGTSWLYIARGVGALISPLIAMSLISLTDRNALGRAIRIGMFVTVFGYFVFGVSTTPIMGMLGTFLGHFGAALTWTFSRIILQQTTPDYVRGRVMALDDVLMSASTSSANLLAGFIASQTFPEAGVLSVVAMGFVGAVAWVFYARKQLKPVVAV